MMDMRMMTIGSLFGFQIFGAFFLDTKFESTANFSKLLRKAIGRNE